MDQSNKPVNDPITEDTDLSKQYQDILNQYSKELQDNSPKTAESQSPDQADNSSMTSDQAKEEPPFQENLPTDKNAEDVQDSSTETSPASADSILTESTSPISDSMNNASLETQGTTQSEPNIVSGPVPLPDDLVNTPPPTRLPPPPSSLPPTLPTLENHPQSNIFKYFFFASFFIFIGVVGTIFYTVSTSSSIPSYPPSSPPTPTKVPVVGDRFCEINDKKITVGESFPAADACNKCTCTDDLTISCTENDCDAASDSELTYSIPEDWKTYTDSKYKYEYSCPADYIQETVETSSDGKAKPFKQEKCALEDNYLQVEVWDKDAELEDDGIISESLDGNYKIKMTGQDETFFNEASKSLKQL